MSVISVLVFMIGSGLFCFIVIVRLGFFTKTSISYIKYTAGSCTADNRCLSCAV